MPGGNNSLDHIGLSVFLQEAEIHEVNKFLEFLSPGDGRRVQFWRESVVAADQPTRLAALLHDNCQDGPGQLKDVRPDDEKAFKFDDLPSEAQRYSSELRFRMTADLEAEFSKPWPGKCDVLKMMSRRKPKKSCFTQ